MKCVHVLRKPCSESTVAANVLRHGTGAMNIEATRISAPDTAGKVWMRGGNQKGASLTTNSTGVHQYLMANPAGRWPANLILQHLDGCVQDGVKKVPGHKGYPNGPKGKSTHYSSDARSVEVRPNPWVGHADPDGTETVAAWACAPGCPVARLDAQSGVLSPQGAPKKADTRGSSFLGTGFGGDPTTFYGDTSGASRFFKQVKS